jgi:hypothetical protein
MSLPKSTHFQIWREMGFLHPSLDSHAFVTLVPDDVSVYDALCRIASSAI